MTRDRLTWTVLVVLVWTAMMSFGGVAAETVMLYPNIFGDPPASLDRAREFLVAGGPVTTFRRSARPSCSPASPRRC